MYASYGQYGAYGQYGSGGGVLLPASPADILQWLRGVESDGITINDRINPLQVDPEPAVRDVNRIEFSNTAADNLNYGDVENMEDADARWSITVNTAGTAGLDYLFSRYNTVQSTKAYFLAVKADGTFRFDVSGDGGSPTSMVSVGTIDDSTDHKIDIFKSGTSVYVYIDGIFDALKTTMPASIFASSEDVYVGGVWQDGVVGNSYDGQAADFILDKTPTELDLYFYCGQSNCCGFPDDGFGSLSTRLQGDNLHYYELNRNKISVITNDLLHPQSSSLWGAELVFGQSIYARSGRKCAIVKACEGATSLAVDWQKGGTGNYEAAITAYQTAKTNIEAQGYTIGDVRFIWMQGEEDTETTAHADNYEANYDQMISDMEGDLGVSFANHTICRIHDLYLTANGIKVRDAQVAIGSRAGNNWIDTDAYSMNADTVHFDSTGLQSLGADIGSTVVVTESTTKIIESPMQEGSDSPDDISGNSNHSTTAGCTWTTVDGVRSVNHNDGFTRWANFNDVAAEWDTQIPANSVDRLEFFGNMLSRSDGSGDFYCFYQGDAQLYINGAYQYTFRDDIGNLDPVAGTDSRVISKVAMDYSDPDNPELYIDDVLVKTSTTVDFVPTATTVKISNNDGHTIKDGNYGHVKMWSGSTLVSHIIPTYEDKLYDVINEREVVPASGTTLDSGKLVPALSDGSGNDAYGNPITNPGGFVHNGSEVTLQQTDTNFDVFAAATTLWGNGVDTWNKVSYADFLAYVNGTNNSWLKWKSVNGVCLLYETWQYLQTKSLTEGEYNKNVTYVGGAPCGGGIVPFP